MAPLPGFLEAIFAPRATYPSEKTISDLELAPLDLNIDQHLPSVASSPARDVSTPTTNLQSRDTTPKPATGAGTASPGDFNNAGMLALFAILGAAMVVASLWFFFWAKNGGFKWRKGDWEDYKSTVLRRKGPDGKTLSNATKSTKLGGGTIAGSQHYKWQQHMARSVVGRDEKGRKGIRAKRGWANTHSVTYSDDYLTDSLGTQTVTDMTEVRTEADPTDDAHHQQHHHSTRYRDRDVREYKREKPARVGGMNRVADGSHYDYTNSERSDLSTDVMTESSEQPMLQQAAKEDKRRQAEKKEQARAERKAREHAAKMERRWKREAEAAAAATRTMAAYDPAPSVSSSSIAEYVSAPPASPPPAVRKSAAPAAQPAAYKQRRAPSPRKSNPPHRDFSYTPGDAASEILSTAYTSESGTRAPSYYDAYRPHQRVPSEDTSAPVETRPRSARQSSPRKKASGGGSSRYQGAGYRRGGMDSDLE